ncbi:glyoxalase [Euhalothece natronophila Z-M001]|uniref:Glyoxalase n=1 Tax=Euhalothece natronophila Z-M001 TaxID=522448 RepID=A0A5B8NLQ8_9CHRO|nr:VOC family protein [Euhalothece natronophila]QDZ40202.1 glyoxalase [Euhalothece natronophila Z-M001]
MKQPIFHLAIPIKNITDAKAFYVNGLGCEVGRETEQAVILNFYGHQVVAHVTNEELIPQKGIYPRHFGMIFPTQKEWETIWQRATSKQLQFYQNAKHRFPGELTEHRTFFLQDPFYNLLEFKHYSYPEAIFGGQELTAVGDRTH